MRYRYINGEVVEAVAAPGGAGDGGSDQISFTFADGAPGRAHKSLLTPLDSDETPVNREDPVSSKPFDVGDIVRFRPYEYRVLSFDHPDEVEMEPVVEGFGDRWHIDPEQLEYVRTPPPAVEHGSVWEHSVSGYRIIVAVEGTDTYFTSGHETPLRVDPEYIRGNFTRLL